MQPWRQCAESRALPALPVLLRRLGDERGNASLEFLGAGLVLLVPLVYLIVALAAIQSGAFAVEGAARQSARLYAGAADDADARTALTAAVEVVFADYGVSSRPEMSVVCRPDPRDCLARGGTITVTVATRVRLPLAPAFLGDGVLPVPVRASATQPVSRFRAGGP